MSTITIDTHGNKALETEARELHLPESIDIRVTEIRDGLSEVQIGSSVQRVNSPTRAQRYSALLDAMKNPAYGAQEKAALAAAAQRYV